MRAETSNACGTQEAIETQQVTMATQAMGLPPFPGTSQHWFLSGNNTYRSLLSVWGRDGSKVNHEKLVQILAREKQQTAAMKKHMSWGLERMHQMGANTDHGVHSKLTRINV